MASPSVTFAGRVSDALLPPAVNIRLRALRNRPGVGGLHAPPRLLLDLLTPGRMALDVGAHRGMWTYWMARRAGTVHAFEPNPDLFTYLSRVHLQGVQVHQVALSDVVGTAVLSIPEGEASGRGSIAQTDGAPVATVETRPLDDFGFADVGLVKVDVEGHEEAVLKGAEKTLRASHPIAIVEIEERHNPGALSRIPAKMSDLGYAHAYFLLEGRLHPLETFDARVHQLDVADVTSPAYVNNFVFATKSLSGRSS